jgi:hypothetical protein
MPGCNSELGKSRTTTAGSRDADTIDVWACELSDAEIRGFSEVSANHNSERRARFDIRIFAWRNRPGVFQTC